MVKRFLLDTDIVVEYLRGRKPAITYLEKLEGDLFISVITVAELFAGVAGKEESQSLDQFLQAFEVVPLDEDLAKEGGLYRKGFFRSHGIGLADALIAATVDRIHATLVTFNRRHFPMLKDTTVPYKRKGN